MKILLLFRLFTDIGLEACYFWCHCMETVNQLKVLHVHCRYLLFLFLELCLNNVQSKFLSDTYAVIMSCRPWSVPAKKSSTPWLQYGVNNKKRLGFCSRKKFHNHQRHRNKRQVRAKRAHHHLCYYRFKSPERICHMIQCGQFWRLVMNIA